MKQLLEFIKTTAMGGRRINKPGIRQQGVRHPGCQGQDNCAPRGETAPGPAPYNIGQGHDRPDAVPQAGEIVNGQVVGYPKPADYDPTRPEKEHADSCDAPPNDATLVVVFQLSTPDQPIILKKGLISLSVKNLQVK